MIRRVNIDTRRLIYNNENNNTKFELKDPLDIFILHFLYTRAPIIYYLEMNICSYCIYP